MTTSSRSTSANTTMSLTQPKTFANIAKINNKQFPNKKLAIVINTIQEINSEEYVYAIGDIIGPSNITHQSKLSNNRLCIFLSSKERVDEIINSHNIVNIGNQSVEIRRYINPAQRIIISNVCPSIPHAIIEEALTYHGIKMVSPITFLRAGMMREEYKHILSFRRQVYIPSEDDKEIPTSLIINHEDTSYRIFLSTDTICYSCKQKGHMASRCPNKVENTNNTITGTTPILINQQNDVTEESKETAKVPEVTIANTQTQPNASEKIDSSQESIVPSTKRSAASVSSIEEDYTTESIDDTTNFPLATPKGKRNKINKTPAEQKKNQPKKKRGESPDGESLLTLEQILLPIKPELETNPNLYSLSYTDLYKFLEEVQGSTEQLKIGRKYTSDVSGLLFTLKELREYLTERMAKVKFTKLVNHIKDQLSEEVGNRSPTPKYQI